MALAYPGSYRAQLYLVFKALFGAFVPKEKTLMIVYYCVIITITVRPCEGTVIE